MNDADMWMCAVEHLLVLVGYVTMPEGVNLQVAFISTPDDPVSESYPLNVLKHFREVRAFAPAGTEQDERIRIYVAEPTVGEFALTLPGEAGPKLLN
jgi:hypothetical protein